MSRLNLNIFIFNLFFMSPEFVFSFDFKVIQPKSVSVQHVNQEQTASISCEHDMGHEYKLLDVRLNRISQNGEEEMLCQKGKPSCKDVNLTLSSTKFVFTLRNIKPEAIIATYQCEITMEYEDVDYTRKGTTTRLLHDFHVIQPEVQHVNPDKTASISCEPKAEGSTIQVARLYRISQDNSEHMFDQKSSTDSCSAVITHQCNQSKVVFILQEVGPEEMKFTYQCEIIVKEKDLVYVERGKVKKLQEREKDCPCLDRSALGRILIGLLVLMFLYSSVMTCLYFRLKATVWKNTKENSTYVLMKPPTNKRQHEDIYQIMQS